MKAEELLLRIKAHCQVCRAFSDYEADCEVVFCPFYSLKKGNQKSLAEEWFLLPQHEWEVAYYEVSSPPTSLDSILLEQEQDNYQD